MFNKLRNLKRRQKIWVYFFKKAVNKAVVNMLKERPLTKEEEKWHERLYGKDEWMDKNKINK